MNNVWCADRLNRIEKALCFQNGYVPMKDFTYFSSANAGFTFALWVKVISGINDEVSFLYCIQDREFSIGLIQKKIVVNINSAIITGINDLVENTWTHVAVTYDLDTKILNIYLNSKLDKTDKCETLTDTGITSAYLGYKKSTAKPINAAFDEIKIYNGPLYKEQIEKLVLVSFLTNQWLFDKAWKDIKGAKHIDPKKATNYEWYADRKNNAEKAIYFKKGYAEMKDSPYFSSNYDGFTIAFWVKIISGVGNLVSFLEGKQESEFSIGLREKKIIVNINGAIIAGNNIFVENVWSHVGVTYNSSTNSLQTYINAVLDKESKCTTLTATSITTLFIGKKASTYIDAAFDDLRFYSAALDQSEINQIIKS